MTAVEDRRPAAAVGDVYGCAEVVKIHDGRRAYGRYRAAPPFFAWVCRVCGYKICAASTLFNPRPRIDEHERLGHTPCERCGEVIRNCKDGSPRRHRWDKCPGKDESYRVVTTYARDRTEALA